MQDWSLDPRIRAILSKLPLPFSLPTELRRTPSRAEGGELAGMRALLTGLGDDLDRALLSTVRQAGAEVGVAAAIPWSSLPVGVRHESWPDDTAESLIQIVRDGGETRSCWSIALALIAVTRRVIRKQIGYLQQPRRPLICLQTVVSSSSPVAIYPVILRSY